MFFNRIGGNQPFAAVCRRHGLSPASFYKFKAKYGGMNVSDWRYDYNNVRPHSSLGNQTPAEARRALEQFEGSAHAALAQTDDEEYEIQTRKLSL